MAKGAKQKSNVVLMASGSKHARPLEPKMKRKIGPPPAHFAGVALETWKMIVAELDGVGVIFQVDRVALEALCVAHQRLRETQESMQELGIIYQDDMGKWVKNPACTVETAANNAIARFSAEFGLTSASRGKVQATPETQKNRFEGF